ncbi:MAG: hypothetical protein IIX37_03935 [Selenomonadaceae bacterium]|nr:hypothetical protein [Selenomonadaceae bacterium]
MIDKYKLAASLGLAALAGLTAMAAGLMSEARASVVLGRTLCSFLITGVLVYIGVFLFERFGYRDMIDETEAAMAELAAQEKAAGEELAAAAADDGTAEPAGAEQPAGTAEEAAGPSSGFEPLQADSLRRVVGSDDSGQGDTR